MFRIHLPFSAIALFVGIIIVRQLHNREKNNVAKNTIYIICGISIYTIL